MSKIVDISPKAAVKPASSELVRQYVPGELPLADNWGGMQVYSNSIRRGYGDRVFGVSDQGLWLGAADFDSAPFKVDMDGFGTITGLNVNYGSANLMPDRYSNFEYWTNDDNVGGVTNCMAKASTTTVYEGYMSLKMTPSDVDARVFLWNTVNYIPVKENTTYIFSVYAKKATSGTTNIRFRADDQGNNTFYTSDPITISDEWDRYYTTFTTETGDTGIRPVIYGSNADTSVIYFDAVQIEEQYRGATEPSKYSSPSGSGVLNADKINAGTITGRTVQTATTGQRIVIDGSNNHLTSYDSSGTIRSRMDGDVLEFYDDNGVLKSQIEGVDIGAEGVDGLKILAGPAASWKTFLFSSAGFAFNVGGGITGAVAVTGNVYLQEGNLLYGMSPDGNNSVTFGRSNFASYISTSAGDLIINPAGNDFYPGSTGSVNCGNSTGYWNDVSYKTLTDRGCLGYFDEGVEMPDGKIYPDLKAISMIKKRDDGKQTIYGAPMLDYKTFPRVAYKQATYKDEILPRNNNDEPYHIADEEYIDSIGRRRVRKVKNQASDGIEMTSMFSIFIGAFKEISERLEQLESKNA